MQLNLKVENNTNISLEAESNEEALEKLLWPSKVLRGISRFILQMVSAGLSQDQLMQAI
ncbi:MAG: hypothetical protein KDC52_15040 [Ignavibacteriae bacterium]|nr:hypothetical protein [Ignavibacteriota bacterium]MCB0752785.1 hypothetical protein [Ignavibacteriota bacterium]MCB9249896.1 hypothetical protein [Ignavibacteriales bacterium]